MLFALILRNRKIHWRGRRVHHGFAGLVLVAIGAFLCLDDALDCRWWISDWRRVPR